MSVLSLELLAKTAYQMGGVCRPAVRLQPLAVGGGRFHAERQKRTPADRRRQHCATPAANSNRWRVGRSTTRQPARNNAAVTYYSAVGTLTEVAVWISPPVRVELLNHHSIMGAAT
ncbi:hypothetical protein M8494_27080 [Serratia ureilytica]